jgi:hypothetical protein
MQSYAEPDLAFIYLLALMHSFVKQEVLALALPLLASRRILRICGPSRTARITQAEFGLY